MLRELSITHFAIIEDLTIEFRPGLNIMTGETGAGKSIIIDALNLVLGGRADADSIRTGEKSATVEAVFEIHDPQTLEMVRDLGLETEDDRLIIKRILSSTEKNRTLLNGGNITVAALGRVGDRLVDIHGQHDHQALLHPENHVDILDLYGHLMPERRRFAEEFSLYQANDRKLAQMLASERDRLQREDLLSFQIKEIDQAGLSENEEEELKGEHNKMRHAESISQALQRVQDILADGEGAVMERLGTVNNELRPLTEIDPELEKSSKQSQTIFYELQDLAAELRTYADSVEFNPARLEEIDDRLAEINALKRKYGDSIAAILEHRENIATELETISSNKERIEALAAEQKEREKKIAQLAIVLAEKREKTAKDIKKNVERELKELNMKHARFGVSFHYGEEASGFVSFRDKKVQPTAVGIGVMEFLFSSNPGEDLKSLAKIASGGEISRVMLALKTILNEQDKVPVMVFDEVDSGIGGRVAEKVGLKLKQIVAGKQVFCITHLPQIAGMADAHFHIFKEVSGKRTRTRVKELSYDERVEEIARMSGGEKITTATLKHAKEMIK